MSVLLRMLVASLSLLAPVLAQDSPPPAESPPTEPPQQQPAPAEPPPVAPTVARPAMVNNSSITAADVALQTRLLGSTLQRLDPAAREHLARRAVAEEILLSQEAVRLDAEMTDREVDEWWERRTGQAPDYDALAAATGTTPERQREVARRSALADLYLLHRCGLRSEQAGRLPPEPLLVRVVTITPSQLREAFAQNRALFDRPEALELELWDLPDEPALEAAAAALDAGNRPNGEPVVRTIGVPDCPRVFMPEVAEWLATAVPGAHLALDTHRLLAVKSRQPGRVASFAEVQEPLRNLLLNELLQEARKHLVDGLRDHATYWPPDLFDPVAPPIPAEPNQSP